MFKKFLAISLLVAAAFAETAYFEFQDHTGSKFVVEFKDDAKITHARELVAGTTTDEPHVFGKIVKEPASYNPGWTYFLDPESVNFFAHAIEVCDATFQYTEDHLDEVCGAFLPGCFFCPWYSKILKEVKL